MRRARRQDRPVVHWERDLIEIVRRFGRVIDDLEWLVAGVISRDAVEAVDARRGSQNIGAAVEVSSRVALSRGKELEGGDCENDE